MLDSRMYLHPNTILKRKMPSYFCYWVVFHLLFCLLFFPIFAFYKIEKRLTVIGYYQNNQVRIVTDKSFFQLKTENLKINEKMYLYHINKIQPIAYEEGKASLWEVMISVNLPDSWKVDNNQFELSFIQEETTLLKQFLKTIKKGMRL